MFFGGGTPSWSGVRSGDLIDRCLLVVFCLVFVIPPVIFFVLFSTCCFVVEGAESVSNACGAGVLHPYADMSVCTPCVVVEGAASGGGVSALGCLQFVDGCHEGIEPMFDPTVLSGGAGHWGGRSGCERWG